MRRNRRGEACVETVRELKQILREQKLKPHEGHLAHVQPVMPTIEGTTRVCGEITRNRDHEFVCYIEADTAVEVRRIVQAVGISEA